MLGPQFMTEKTSKGKKLITDPAFSVQTLFQGNQIADEVKILFIEEFRQIYSEER